MGQARANFEGSTWRELSLFCAVALSSERAKAAPLLFIIFLPLTRDITVEALQSAFHPLARAVYFGHGVGRRKAKGSRSCTRAIDPPFLEPVPLVVSNLSLSMLYHGSSPVVLGIYGGTGQNNGSVASSVQGGPEGPRGHPQGARRAARGAREICPFRF